MCGVGGSTNFSMLLLYFTLPAHTQNMNLRRAVRIVVLVHSSEQNTLCVCVGIMRPILILIDLKLMNWLCSSKVHRPLYRFECVCVGGERTNMGRPKMMRTIMVLYGRF